MTEEAQLKSHRDNISRMNDMIQKIVSPKVIQMENYRKAVEIRQELRNRIERVQIGNV